MCNSITTHQGAIAIDFYGDSSVKTRLVVEAKLDPVKGELNIAFPINLMRHGRSIIHAVGQAMGWRLGSSFQTAVQDRDGETSYDLWCRSQSVAGVTGNGRWHVAASIIDKIPPPCPICNSSGYAKKAWGKTTNHCNLCRRDYGTAPRYTDGMGREINPNDR